MFQLSLAAGQSAADLAQTMRPLLAEEHGHKLAPTPEATGLVLGLMVADSLFELRSWKQL